MIVVYIFLAALGAFLLYRFVKLLWKKQAASEPVSPTDKLTQSEDYTRKLEHYAQQLSEISEELQRLTQEYERETESGKKEELAQKLSQLEKQRQLASTKCRKLLKKLD